MRTRKGLLLLSLLVSTVAFADRPNAQAPPAPTATLYGVGHLAGGSLSSLVRDATRGADGALYAVGGSGCAGNNQTPPCGSPDTAMLWRFDGTTATRQALPDLVTNTTGNSNLTAFDITADAAYIASQARSALTGNATSAVRVDRSLLPSPSANLDLATIAPGMGAAFAISDTGTVLYGALPGAAATAGRVDTASGTSVIIPKVCTTISLPGCAQVHNANFIVARGTSADGSVAVGISSVNQIPVTRRAFRYVHATGTSTAIPLLPGGLYNNAVALSPDGDTVLVTGNANGILGNAIGTLTDEVYLYTASTDSIERLGSPNSFWGSGGRLCLNNVCGPTAPLAGGMTADGSVVVINFAGQSLPGESTAYIHNEHGWFHFKSVLAASGIDFRAEGWGTGTAFVIYGISQDGTLVFGQGVHNGTIEGFVAEFPVGALASFNPTPSPPADPSIVGAWRVPDETDQTVVFTADGAYFHIGRKVSGTFVMTGFERGYYTYNGSVITVTTLFDTNGQEGFSDGNGLTFPVAVTGNTFTFLDDPEGPDLIRLVGDPGSIVGGWVQGNPLQPNSSFVVVFSDSGHILQATDNPEFGGPGAEHGTYTFGPAITCAPFSHELNIFPDDGGSPDLHNCGTLSSNELEIHALDDDGHTEFHFARVIDPRTPVITSALDAVATTGLPFSYQITATNTPTTFGAIGLPPWMQFDIDTGVISGTPPTTAVGTVDIRIEASNTLSTSTGRNHLSIVVIEPALVSTGATTVTPIPPEEPGGTPPVTIEFENVTNGGTISVVSIDPESDDPSSPEPPAGFSLGDDPVYFEILPSEGLTFTGPVTVCFSYEGITFSGFPRLLHYDVELMTWVDITTSVDTDNQIICGLTSSFSPFVIAATAKDAKGFHAPIKPVPAGELNSVKGGATVALKFNVFGEGNVEITDPDALDATFEARPIVCEEGTPSGPDVFATTGNAGLRYDTASHQFVQNWKTPTLAGCYLVQVKGDGLLLSALFKVK